MEKGIYMKLKKIYFDAYKSLVDTELVIKNNCIGFVGTNESGKSNILNAIKLLDRSYKILNSDTPKMSSERNPYLKFEFDPSGKLRKRISETLKEWMLNNSLVQTDILNSDYTIKYNVLYNKETNQEERFFVIDGIQLSNEHRILKKDKKSEIFNIKKQNSLIPLSKSVLIEQCDIDINEELKLKDFERYEIRVQIEQLKKDIEELKNKIISVKEVKSEESAVDGENTNVNEINKLEDNEIINTNSQIQTELFSLEKSLDEKQLRLDIFNKELEGDRKSVV